MATTALVRLHYIATTKSHAQAIVDVLASALHLPPSPPATTTSSSFLHLGNALLEITALPAWVSMARQSAMLNRPDVARLRGVDVFLGSATSTTTGATGRTASPSYQDARAWLTEDRPVFTPIVRNVFTSNQALASTITPRVREIVLGAAGPRWTELSSLADELEAVPCPGLPHVYTLQGSMAQASCDTDVKVGVNDAPDSPPKYPASSSPSFGGGNGIALRLLHSPMSALVLQVEAGGLAAAKEDLWSRGLDFEEIGGTGATEGQILLSSPQLRGMDVRICDGGSALSPYFNEGDEVLREHVFEELNPAIAQPLAAMEGDRQQQQASSPAAAYRRMGSRMGDCWSEFRSQLKRPGGFFTTSSSSSSSPK